MSDTEQEMTEHCDTCGVWLRDDPARISAGLCARCEIEKLQKERDEAQAKCANLADNLMKLATEVGERKKECDETRTAYTNLANQMAQLATKCGYVRIADVAPLVEVLRYTAYNRLPLGNTVIETLPEHWQAKIYEVLAHWEKVRKQD